MKRHKDIRNRPEKTVVASNVRNTERGYGKTLAAFTGTLSDLQPDYLGLYLIHWPSSPSRFPDREKINLKTWRAMTELQKADRIRAIGVFLRFLPHHLDAPMGTDRQPVNPITFYPAR